MIALSRSGLQEQATDQFGLEAGMSHRQEKDFAVAGGVDSA